MDGLRGGEQLLDMGDELLTFFRVKPHIGADQVPFGVDQAEAVGVTAAFDSGEKEHFCSDLDDIIQWPSQEQPAVFICVEVVCVLGQDFRCIDIRIDGDAHELNRFSFELGLQQSHFAALSFASSWAGCEEEANDIGFTDEFL